MSFLISPIFKGPFSEIKLFSNHLGKWEMRFFFRSRTTGTRQKQVVKKMKSVFLSAVNGSGTADRDRYLLESSSLSNPTTLFNGLKKLGARYGNDE